MAYSSVSDELQEEFNPKKEEKEGTIREFADIEETICSPAQRHPKPDVSTLVFGKYFTDHMLEIPWEAEKGWAKPVISPMHDLKIHPGAKVLHYAIELFEGMKAYRGEDGRLRLFRPDRNMERMLNTSLRASLPGFDTQEMIKCIKRLVQVDRDWIPHSTTSPASLYIRPTFIATDPSLGVASPKHALMYVILCPVGSYFASGLKPVSLMADPQYVRSWPGGCGAAKMGANYAPTIEIQKRSEILGHQQVLWLYGNDHKLTEVGTMNIFVYLINKKGERELITPPLDGLILPGVTRLSLLELAREWKEFHVTERSINMAEVLEALKENRLLEIFGAGTACVVCPVFSIIFGEVSLVVLTHLKRLFLCICVITFFLKALVQSYLSVVCHPSSWIFLILCRGHASSFRDTPNDSTSCDSNKRTLGDQHIKVWDDSSRGRSSIQSF
nr:EOG090X051P [Eurycercus lamellatus]